MNFLISRRYPFKIFRQHESAGFTLTELLVASLIAGILAVITAQVMISQLFEERRLAVAQALREDVSRLNYLVQIEASEAESIELGAANPPGCAGGADSFTLLVPRPGGTYADPNATSRIQYYNAPDPLNNNAPAIWRCGPPVSRNGVLLHDADPANVTGVALGNAQLTRGPGNGCPASDLRSVTYRIVPPANLQGSNLGDLGGCVTAHARSVFVCNPPNNVLLPCTDPNRIGDCDCV